MAKRATRQFPWGKEEKGVPKEMWDLAKDRTDHLRHEFHLRRTPLEMQLAMAYLQGILDAAETMASRDMLKPVTKTDEEHHLAGLA